jgi:hypothetical protein
MADITVDVSLPSALSVDVTSPTQALATNVSIPGPQGPRGEKGNPTSVNNLTAENIAITGADGNIVYTSGDSTIFISGNSGYFQSAVNSLTTNLNSTGANLNTKIDTFSGTYQSFVNNLDTTYATDTQLQNTGSTLNTKIDNLSGYVNSQDLSISNNLASTGSSLQVSINSVSSNLISTGVNLDNKINSLSGTLTGNYLTTSFASNTYATITNLSNTGSNLNTKIDNFSGTYQNFVDNLDITYATDNQLQNTGSTLNQSISSLSDTLTNNYYLKSNPSGFITGVDLSSYLTSSTASSIYATIVNLENTGSTLQNQINNLDNTYAIDVNLSLTGQTLDQKINTFSGTYQNFVDNIDLTYATDIQLQNTGSSLINNINSLSGTLTSNYATILNLASTGSSLQNQINNLDDTYATDTELQNTGITLFNSITALSNTLTSNYATIINLASTGSTLATNLSLTGATLQNQIDNLDLTYATDIALASTGNTLQTQINNLGTTYATVTNLALTGSTLENKISSLSGTLTSDYATIVNLASTGTTLQNYINSLSGSSVLLYGDQTIDGTKTFRDKVYIHDLYVTGEEFIANVTNNFIESPYILLNLTGGATDGGIFFVTGVGLTGINDLGPIIGFDHTDKFKFGISSRGSDLSTLNDIAAVQDITAYSGFVDGKYATIINLASTGSTLQNQIDNLGNTYATVTNLASTGSTLDSKIGSLSGTLTSTYATITNLGLTGSTLQTQIDNLGNTYATVTNLASTGSTLDSKIGSLSGTLTSTYATITNLGLTGSTLQTQIDNLGSTYATVTNLTSTGSTLNTKIDNLSGYVNSSNSNIVFTTGNQLINGTKTFNSGIAINVQPTGTNPALYITGTWNNSSQVYTGIDLNITDTNSNSTTNFINFRTNDTSRLRIRKDGAIFARDVVFGSDDGFSFGDVAGGGISCYSAGLEALRITRNVAPAPGIVFTRSNGGMTFSEGHALYSQGTDIIGQVRGTNPQSFRIFNITGTNSGEFGLFGWQNNQLVIGSQATNSGISRDILLTGNNVLISGANIRVDRNGRITTNDQIARLNGAFGIASNGADFEFNSFGTTRAYIRAGGSFESRLAGGGLAWNFGVGTVLFLGYDADHILAQKNGTNAQQFRVYNATGTNSGEFGLFGWQNNNLIIGAQQSQSGILRDVFLTGRNISINASGVFNIFDNTNILGDLNVTGNILLSGNPVLTGVDLSSYATINNLASTGSTLDTKINDLSGSAVLLYGDQDITGNKTLSGSFYIGGQGHEQSAISIRGIDGISKILNLRDKNGENGFFVQGEIGTDLLIKMGDVDAAYNDAYLSFDQASALCKIENANLEVNGDIKFGSPGSASATLYMYDGPNDAYNTIYWSDSEMQLINTADSSNITIQFSSNGNTLISNSSFLKLPTGKNDFLAMDSEVVHKTGNETISGIKAFISRPTVNGTGVLLSGEVAPLPTTIVYTTGDQIISGVKTFIGNHIISGNVNITGDINTTGLIVSGLGNSFILKSPNNFNSVYFEPTLNGNAGILRTNYLSTITLYNDGDQNLTLSYGGGGTRSIIFRGGGASVNRVLLDSNGNFGIGSGISSVPSRFYVSGNSTLQGDLTVSGNTTITGHLSAASKSFLIDHPTIIGKKLQYGSLESPYHGIRLTDKNKISADSVKVNLPDYISALVNEDKVNVQLTNINHDKILFVKEVNVKENNFVVGTNRGWFDKNEYEFYWSFTAERKDIPKLTVEF